MDDSRFDNLARLVGKGASRRAIFKGLLGLGGAAAVGGAILVDSDARTVGTRPSLPPPPTRTPTPVPPPTKTPTPTPDPCPAPNVRCGFDCCSDELLCCDGECCPEGTACLTQAFYGESATVEEEVCCDLDQTCDGQCCTGTCFWPLVDGVHAATVLDIFNRTCCPAEEGFTFCPGEGQFSTFGLCCSGETPECCRDVQGRPVCLTVEQCCTGDECPDDPGTCGAGFCSPQFTCELTSLCDPGEDCCEGGNNTCCASPNVCCGDSCCDADQCNEIDDVCCPDGSARCGTGDEACCAAGLQCCTPEKVCGICCDDDDCAEVNDFPNCMRSHCDLSSRTCELFDVCVEEGRVCCPGETVGFCYSPQENQCCTNDDCPGCDVCTHGASGDFCHGSCLPSFLSCCELGDDPDAWFCYNARDPLACPVICTDDDDCEHVNDFPNCMRSRCNMQSGACELFDVCVEEGRVCCPGDEVGFCFSPGEGQCCTNDDCPGCDVCTHGASGDVCHGSCLPAFLSCCELGDDPDQWFCYHPDNAEACPACAVDTDCPGECHTCMNGVCTSTDARCFGDCGSCQNGTCFVDPAKCSGCEICAVVGDGQYECIDSDDECSGNPDGSNCCNGTCEPCCQDADCPGCQICASTGTGRVCIDSDDECSGNPDGSNCCNAVCTDCCLDTDCPGCQICASTEAGRVCIDSDDECSGNPEGSNCCNASCTECCVDTDCPGCQICASTELGRICIDSDDECSGNPAGSNCCAAVCTDDACESALTITAAECIPDCAGTTCGSDGCTGSCGDCTDFVNSYCDHGTCNCAPATCESLGTGCSQWVNDGCGIDLYCGDCPVIEEPVNTPVPEDTCLAEGDRCVHDNQCCAGLCRGRNCGDRGRKMCTTACSA